MLVLATNNQGKIREIEALLQPYALPVQSARDLGFTQQVEETGQTFLQNATLKALAIASALQLPALADDSGLCVTALNNAPGILSARFAGPEASDEQNNQALLAAMQGMANRQAYFACAMVCAKPNGQLLNATGELHGHIGWQPQGNNGFGYDPLFVLPTTGRTLAQMQQKDKNVISHRGQALRRLMEQLPAFLGL